MTKYKELTDWTLSDNLRNQEIKKKFQEFYGTICNYISEVRFAIQTGTPKTEIPFPEEASLCRDFLNCLEPKEREEMSKLNKRIGGEYKISKFQNIKK